VQKTKDVSTGNKENKITQNVLSVPAELNVAQQRQRRQQERKELLSKSQGVDKKVESSEPDPEVRPEIQNETTVAVTRGPSVRGEEKPEQPFIVLSQDEYAEHHSSIMHCRYQAP
ncbi:hypothetical protein GDO86_018894, partial [Hymenochirus boettgeri]